MENMNELCPDLSGIPLQTAAAARRRVGQLANTLQQTADTRAQRNAVRRCRHNPAQSRTNTCTCLSSSRCGSCRQGYRRQVLAVVMVTLSRTQHCVENSGNVMLPQ